MKYYINIDGKDYRCSVCWNAVAMYLKEKGLESLSDFGEITKMSASDALIMMYWSLYFGEDIEGRELPFASSQKLGNVLGAGHIAKFVMILNEQMKSQLPQDAVNELPSDQKKKKLTFFK